MTGAGSSGPVGHVGKQLSLSVVVTIALGAVLLLAAVSIFAWSIRASRPMYVSLEADNVDAPFAAAKICQSEHLGDLAFYDFPTFLNSGAVFCGGKSAAMTFSSADHFQAIQAAGGVVPFLDQWCDRIAALMNAPGDHRMSSDFLDEASPGSSEEIVYHATCNYGATRARMMLSE